ncbi:hypothetical protein CF326_g9260 [Tilletia indica]|nr:hypothetical protein CF326_g9260 [Tilletia indica]
MVARASRIEQVDIVLFRGLVGAPAMPATQAPHVCLLTVANPPYAPASRPRSTPTNDPLPPMSAAASASICWPYELAPIALDRKDARPNRLLTRPVVIVAGNTVGFRKESRVAEEGRTEERGSAAPHQEGSSSLDESPRLTESQ